MTLTVTGLHLGWGRFRQRPAFQMCLARAVTVPERFKGGTCSFGAPDGDSPARIQTAGMQLAGTSSHGRARP